jgi:hypothetical protein
VVSPLFVGDARLVDAPFGGDAVVAFLLAGFLASRHHQAATLPRFGGEFADRDFAGGSGQYREEQAAAGFGGVGPAGQKCRDDATNSTDSLIDCGPSSHLSMLTRMRENR